MAALAEAVAITERLEEAISTGRIQLSRINALLEARGDILRAGLDAAEPTPRERVLATRLQELDARITLWCRERQRELARARSRLPRQGTTPSPRLVSESA